MSGPVRLSTIQRRISSAIFTQRLPWRPKRLLVASPHSQRITGVHLQSEVEPTASAGGTVLGWRRDYHRSTSCWEDDKEATADEPPDTEAPEVPAESADASPPSSSADSAPPYSTPELEADAAEHKAGLDDPDRPFYQNPLHQNNPAQDKVFREDFDSEEELQAATVPQPPLDLGDGRPPAPEYLHALADEIVHLNMLEMNELVNKIAHHYDFHEGMLSPDTDAAAEGDDEEDGDGEGAKEEAKTSFDIKLVEFDAKAKIKVIKEVRALAGLGLKEAKEMVEGAPKVIHQGVKKEEAEEIKAKLEELGATIEIV